MRVLVDTNIFLRILQPKHPLYLIATRATQTLRDQNETLIVAAQNLVEFWVVCTRPGGENGLGLSLVQAQHELALIKKLFVVLPELPLLTQWERLVFRYRMSGRKAHDARLVAAMKVHGIDSIFTFNVQDFTRYAGITVLDPNLLAKA